MLLSLIEAFNDTNYKELLLIPIINQKLNAMNKLWPIFVEVQMYHEKMA